MTQRIDLERVFVNDELKALDDAALLALLREVWHIDAGAPLVLCGRLRLIKNTNHPFFVMESLHNPDGEAVRYPVSGDVWQMVFVGQLAEKAGLRHGDWVRAEVALSRITEREKQDNCFALKVKGNMERLVALPSAMAALLRADDEVLVAESVWDFLRAQQREQLEAEASVVQEKLQAKERALQDACTKAAHEQEAIIQNIDKAAGKLAAEQAELAALREEIQGQLSLQDDLAQEFQRDKRIWEGILSQLSGFVRAQADRLLALDLLSEEDYARLLGEAAKPVTRSGHDFGEVFGGNVVKAVKYIQAFLYEQGIVYGKGMLIDFFALLCTRDLIVLAGDSGSGKTNLVKSFAKAVGGKAVIVPVKPNWTSAEDLLGYYNPLEQRYLSTPFLDALLEAATKPDIPFFICLDEMNLARVEYYFADFLSLLEEREVLPEIPLYSGTEAAHLEGEVRNFLALVDTAQLKLDKLDLADFLSILRDEALNAKLHELCGFQEGGSLLQYHAQLRRLLGQYLQVPASITLPRNVWIIGTINVDETTHYLAPKILDRAYVMRFANPLLIDWTEVKKRIMSFDVNMALPVLLSVDDLGQRKPYPPMDMTSDLVGWLIEMVREFLDPLGVEFGLRAVRQALHYRATLAPFIADDTVALNFVVLHKVLPKLMFDGEQLVDGQAKKEILSGLLAFLRDKMDAVEIEIHESLSCVHELERVIQQAKGNHWVVNYWAK